jgi:hypothetical protein
MTTEQDLIVAIFIGVALAIFCWIMQTPKELGDSEETNGCAQKAKRMLGDDWDNIPERKK